MTIFCATSFFMLHEEVNRAIKLAFEAVELSSVNAVAVSSSRPGIDRQCNGVIAAAKRLQSNPNRMAARVADVLRQNPLFAEVTIADPGFINLRLANHVILQYAELRIPQVDHPLKIIIDFGGPNIAKALHVGHLRSLVIGESLRRILIARGHHVISDIHLGDWGLPMGMLIAALQRLYPEFPGVIPANFSQVINDLYPQAAQDCVTDPILRTEAQMFTVELQEGHHTAMWEAIRTASLASIKPEICRLGIQFDLEWGEADSRDHIQPLMRILREQMILHTSEEAQVVEITTANDHQPLPPLIFQKGDGGYTYAATDLTTIYMRQQFAPDAIIYVADQRQALHFEQVFRAAQYFNPAIKLTHIGFGTVNGMDGKPYKTRDGGVLTLSALLDAAVDQVQTRVEDVDLAEIVGIGAVKFADLITQRTSGYVFDLERMTATEGKTGPYLQYACVRIAKILATARDTASATIIIGKPIERELLLACANFSEMLILTEQRMMPNGLAEYAFELAQTFSKFYDSCEVLNAKPSIRASRLAICRNVYAILTQCLYLLGIEVPDRM
jgi:arginyl-tRNA synthetase